MSYSKRGYKSNMGFLKKVFVYKIQFLKKIILQLIIKTFTKNYITSFKFIQNIELNRTKQTDFKSNVQTISKFVFS